MKKSNTSVYLIKRKTKKKICRLYVQKEAALPTVAAAAAAAAAAVKKQKEEKMPKGLSHQTENEKEASYTHTLLRYRYGTFL